MNRAFAWKTLLAATLAVLLLGGAWSAASAQRGRPDPGRAPRPAVLAGEIAHMEADDESGDLTLTLQPAKGEAVQVLVTDETRIVPPEATPEVGDMARAVVHRAADPDEIPVAEVLNLAKAARPPHGPKVPRLREACGEIVQLPEGSLIGVWTVRVPRLKDFQLEVTSDTRILPADAAPEAGDNVCFSARPAEEGWIATVVRLEPRPRPGAPRPERRIVVLQGVADVPDSTESPWDLGVAVRGRPHVTVQITDETEIDGELADGVRVVVHALWVKDTDGNRVLVAKRVKVLPERDPAKTRQGVHFEGVVAAVADDGSTWTIDVEDAEDALVVSIDEKTVIVGLAEGDDPVGRQVEGRAVRLEDGTLLAHLLRLETD